MRTLLDTNIVIEFWKQNPQVQQNLTALQESGFIISAITEAELIVGALNKDELRKIHRDMLLLEILPLEPPIGQVAVSLLSAYTLSHRLLLPDALIAATALHHNLPLYTLNRKDFRYIPELVLHEPA